MSSIKRTKTDDDVGTDPRPEVITACNIYKDIEDAFATVEQFDLAAQPGASAEKLAAIEEMATALSTALNELCDCEHSRDSNPEPAADVAAETRSRSFLIDRGGPEQTLENCQRGDSESDDEIPNDGGRGP